MQKLLKEIRACRVCEKQLPLGPRPVVHASTQSRILIIGQAPGTVVHEKGIPWKDASGKRLREWLEVDEDTFYDTQRFGIVPMGFCYPGKGKGGDLPPREECAPLWHGRLLAQMPHLELTLLIGAYAQKYYLGDQREKNLTETVRAFEQYAPVYFPLVHPSPRNQRWLKNNPWFDAEVVPALRKRVQQVLQDVG